MDAIISGRAGVAFLIEGEVLSSFDVEDPVTLLPRRPADLRLVFGEAPDLQFFEDVDHREAAQHLERAFNCASALDLALILLDPELTGDVRADAANELERLLADESVGEYLENILYGRPLPASSDMAGALSRCGGGRLPNLSAALQILEAYQPSIREVSAAWDALPASLFDDDGQRAEFRRLAVHEGLFRQLATEVANGPRGRVDQFMLRALLNPDVKAQRNYRAVLQQWTTPFRPQATAPQVRHEVEDFLEETSLKRRKGRRRRKRKTAEEELNKLQGQFDLITAAMKRRDLAFDRKITFARKITDEIIDYQLQTARPIHAAKTLCNLATEAKSLGIYQLQLEFTERAIQIAPDDGWSWAQYADALHSGQRLREALMAYEQSYAFGHGISAKTGLANVLKALGRFDEALVTYEEASAVDPQNIYAKSGRAETLRAMGRLNDALVTYDAVIAEHPEDVVAKNGRAETLRAMGRLSDALAAYDSALAEHPERIDTKNGRAETLRAMGRLNEALDAYDSTVAEHPEDVFAKSGRAETLRAMGRLNEALDAYDATLAANPHDSIAKTGRCGILMALRRYDEALESLPDGNPGTLQDWIAYHTRGMIMLRTGKVDAAIEIFEHGAKENPIPSSREFFSNALAVACLRRGDLLKAESALEGISTPLMQPQTNVLRLHVFGAGGKDAPAAAAYEKLSNKPWFIPDELLAELHRRYILKDQPRHDDAWVHEEEQDMLDSSRQVLSPMLLAA